MTHRDDSHLSEPEAQVVRALHRAAVTERAPAQLRERLDRQRLEHEHVPARVRSGRGLPALGSRAWSGVAAGVVAAVVAAVLLIPGGAPGAPSISAAAGLAVRGSTLPAPGADPTATYRLTARVENLHFPNWQEQHQGWVAVGARTDRLGDRDVKTVFYTRDGRMIAYSIVSTPELPSSAPRWFMTRNGRTVYTWREGGHTCLLSGEGITAAALQHLVAQTETRER